MNILHGPEALQAPSTRTRGVCVTGTDLDDSIGSLLGGRFRVSAILGRGGMATVYLAQDESLGRPVAVKVFRRDLADGEDLKRQQDEIQLLASLNHPCLVTLFDAASDAEGDAFLVMELVDGTDLHSRLLDGALDRTQTAMIGRDLADALAYVHAIGVIHRDIKPGNILLPKPAADHSGPLAKLADFGIARIVDGSRLTATGKVLGTATYFSPEQALGDPLTPASDIYSLGLVLLECLTGQKAFPGSPVESMTVRLARDPEVPAELGDRWVGLLRGMTSRIPDARPTARDVSGALARLAQSPGATQAFEPTAPQTKVLPPVTAPTVDSSPPDSPLASTPTSTPATSRSPRQRRRLILVVSSIVTLLLAAWLASVAIPALWPAEPDTAVDYPAVDGNLGIHLEQLQRSVEP
jgi:serine/threonine protein kinase